MANMNSRFEVKIVEEKKVNKNLILSFEFQIKEEGNCRIKLEGCNGFDSMGNKHEATEKEMSTTDILIGTSRFFKDSQRVKVAMGTTFNAKNGSALALMVNDIDEKKSNVICFQKKGTRWDMVGIQ